MCVDVRQVGACSVMRLGDRFDERLAARLAEDAGRLCREDPRRRLVIDLTSVGLVDRRAVVALAAALDAPAGAVGVVSGRLSARKILRRWGSSLAVFPTVDEAVGQLAPPPTRPVARFRHEALLYAGPQEFLDAVGDFVGEGVALGEPVLVLVDRAKVERLRRWLGGRPPGVRFADAGEVLRNPACAIPAWREFTRRHRPEGRRVRAVCELVWPGRRVDELVECQHHERLVNRAFGGGDDRGWLLCPYDGDGLGREVLDEAQRSHPEVLRGGRHRHSERYEGGAGLPAPLPEPAAPPAELAFDGGALGAVAAFVIDRGVAAGLWAEEVRDLVRAAHEVAANSVAHGGGRGHLRLWQDGDRVVCEVSDGGQLPDPLVGSDPRGTRSGGRGGLWLANQLCDLVQVRSSADGTTVRLHRRRR